MTLSEQSVAIPKFSTREWAIIALMKRTEELLLRSRLHGWMESIERESDCALRNNIAASLRFASDVWPEEYGGIPPGPEGARSETAVKIATDLTRNGHLLFNSYYYDLLDAFGEKSLVPVVVGTELNNDLTSVMKFFGRQRLPFHLNPDYLPTYTSQILPCTGGLTPLHVTRFSEKRAPRVVRIESFLGDLGLLHQREDFANGHVSALVAALGPTSRGVASGPCIGAFVLTSVVPEAFSEEDAEILDGIIADALALGMLSVDPPAAGASSEQVLVDDLQTAPLSEDSGLENDFHQWLSRELGVGIRDGLVSARVAVAFGKEKDRLLDSSAVNQTAIDRLLRRSFPTGPWLAPSIGLIGGGGPGQPQRVAPDRLIDYADRLRGSLTSETVAHRAKSLEVVQERFGFLLVALRHLLPELGPMRSAADIAALATRILPIPCGSPSNAWAIVVARPEANIRTLAASTALDSLSRLVSQSCNAGRSIEGDNLIFARLEATWMNEPTLQAEMRSPSVVTKSDPRGEATWREVPAAIRDQAHLEERLEHELLEVLRELMSPGQIAAILVCEERYLFLPAISTLNTAALADAYLAQAGFWVFERLSRIFGTIYVGGDTLLEPQLEKYAPLIFRHYLPGVDVRVTRVPNSSQSRQLEHALLFLGIPVRSWANGRVFEIVVNDLSFGTDLLAAYRTFLNFAMAAAPQLPWLTRLLGSGGEGLNVRPLQKECGDLNPAIPVVHSLRFEGADYQIVWTPIRSLGLQLVCIGEPALRSSWSRWWRLEGQDRLQDANGGRGHWQAGSVQSSVLRVSEPTNWTPYDKTSLKTIALRASEVYSRLVRREEQRRRVQAEQDAVWKDFSRAAAHRLDNPLLTALLSVENVASRLEQNRYDDARMHLERIRRSVRAARNRVWRLRSLATRETEHLECVRLDDCLQEATDSLSANGIAVRCSLPPHANGVLANRTQLREAFSELAANATRFLAGVEQPRVTISAAPAAKQSLEDVGLRTDDDFVEVRFEDNGPGIADDRKEEIFIAYISSATDHDGMGLALVRHDIRSFGGEIVERGQIGEGATFIIFLLSVGAQSQPKARD